MTIVSAIENVDLSTSHTIQKPAAGLCLSTNVHRAPSWSSAHKPGHCITMRSCTLGLFSLNNLCNMLISACVKNVEITLWMWMWLVSGIMEVLISQIIIMHCLSNNTCLQNRNWISDLTTCSVSVFLTRYLYNTSLMFPKTHCS